MKSTGAELIVTRCDPVASMLILTSDMAFLHEREWHDLPQEILDRRAIPIVEQGLVTVPDPS